MVAWLVGLRYSLRMRTRAQETVFWRAGLQGNSQSRSTPTALYFVIQDLTLLTNLPRDSAVATILEKYALCEPHVGVVSPLQLSNAPKASRVYYEPWEIPSTNAENKLGSHGDNGGNCLFIGRVHAHQLVFWGWIALAVRIMCPIWHWLRASWGAEVNERKERHIKPLGDLKRVENSGIFVYAKKKVARVCQFH